MIRFVVLLTAITLALPQGWCCRLNICCGSPTITAKAVSPCCSAHQANGTRQARSACCEKKESAAPGSGESLPKGACDCKCSSRSAIPSRSVDSSDHGGKGLSADNLPTIICGFRPESTKSFLVTPLPTRSARWQSLYCNWRC